jgi:hypothetical protein
MFSLSENEMELIERKSTVGSFTSVIQHHLNFLTILLLPTSCIALTGFLGCIFDLDTVMVDLQKVKSTTEFILDVCVNNRKVPTGFPLEKQSLGGG